MRLSRLLLASLTLALTCAVLPRIAWADDVFVQGLDLPGVHIQGINKGQLEFVSSSGNTSLRDLSKVLRIHVDGEPALNTSEDAYASGKFADSVDGYMTTFRSTTKDWVKEYTAGRLIDAANKTKRFDAATVAYIAMLEKDPNAAARMRPAMPDAGSTYIDTAISQVSDALGSSKATDEQRIALLGFQVDLYNAKKDTASADKAAEQLDELLAKDPSNPNAAKAIARRRLQAAGVALEAKKYQEVITTIESNKALFTDPPQQADALFDLAEAHMGLLGDGKDPNALKDVALAYMRVVANFKELPGKPHVASSLLDTAQIEERLNEPDAAMKIYQQLIEQFPEDPAAATAKQNLSKLKPQK